MEDWGIHYAALDDSIITDDIEDDAIWCNSFE